MENSGGGGLMFYLNFDEIPFSRHLCISVAVRLCLRHIPSEFVNDKCGVVMEKLKF